MQGQGSSMGSLSDTTTFDHNSTTANANIEEPMFLNSNTQNYSQNMVPDYITSSSNNGLSYLNSSIQGQSSSGWNMGESSSSGTQNYALHSELKIEDGRGGVYLNQASGQITYSPLLMQSARNNRFPQNLNLGGETGENNGNNHGLMDGNLRVPSNNGGYFGEETYLSRKRKSMDGQNGQSSSSGSSSLFQQREVDEWNDTPNWYNNTNFGSNSSNASIENPLLEAPPPLNLTPSVEPSRRNRRVRISSSPQQSPSPNMLPNGNINVNNISGDSNNILASPHLSLFNPRIPQRSRWSRGSSSSRGGSSLNFEEPELNTLPRNIPENPNLPPHKLPPSWGLTHGNNLNINGNPSGNANPISGSSSVPTRAPPRSSRRLSEFGRSLLSPPVLDSGGQSSNLNLEGESSLQVAPSSGSVVNHIDRLSRLGSALMMESQLDGGFGGASSSRSAPGGSVGSRQLVSEIRNVLNLMRPDEGLRMEDLVILGQSIFFGSADMHDQHRDMRLDIDNMSHEELLELEERIGNVSTGLSEETILDRLKQRKLFSIAMGSQSEVEPCCICREEYNDGEDIGTVECGHEFHSGCIKQWLMLKNLCPICKTTALNK